MKSKSVKKAISIFLCVAMLISCTPFFAYAYDYVSETHQVFSSKFSTIAPGVTSSTNYAYATADDKQMVYYVATADINRDDVLIQSSYMDAQCEVYGMAKLTDQMASATAKYSNPDSSAFISEYYTAVAGTNGDFYNMTTGQPSGAFVLNGTMASNKANNRPWFAVFADGTALCGYNNTDWDAAVTAHGDAQQAVGGSQILVYNGADVTASSSGSYNTERHSRSMVGVTADNKVVICTLDGRQEPFSCGGTMHELAQIMLEQGCVIAINLDGGGSSTFAARQEGEDEVTIVNRPSDGSERSISTGLIIATTSAPTNEFSHAVVTAESEYITPGTSVSLNLKGVSPAGTFAEIPADVTYTATLGTISDGVFTSDGTAGDAEVSVLYNGNVVGTEIIHVVQPDAIAFSGSQISVPFGGTTNLQAKLTYGVYDVKFKESDVVFTLSNSELGVVNGLEFTANDQNISDSNATITVSLAENSSISATVPLKVGKGSVVLFDFEDASVEGWDFFDYYNANVGTTIDLASHSNGKVHSGDYAMAYTVDFSQLTYYEDYITSMMTYNAAAIEAHGYNADGKGYGLDEDYVDITGATGLGFWVYVPDEIDVAGLDPRFTFSYRKTETSDWTRGTSAMGTFFTQRNGMGSDGWYYYYVDLSAFSGYYKMAMQNNRATNVSSKNGYSSKRYYGTFVEWYIQDRAWKDNSVKSYNSKFSLYIDDITVDYSDVVADREPPVFGNICYADRSMSDAAVLNGQTVTDNVISFNVSVSDNMTKSNYSGLDINTAKVYIDGNLIESKFVGGMISVQDVALADGVHNVRFEIADIAGNKSHIDGKIKVNAATALSTISIEPHDDTLESVYVGSLYYIDIKSSDIDKVESLTTTLKVNNVNNWEPDGIEVADGFAVTYTKDFCDEGTININISRTGNISSSGEGVLASIPIRCWYPHNALGKNSNWIIVTKKCVYPMDIQMLTKAGYVTYNDGTNGMFSAESIQIDSEAMCAAGYIGTQKGNEGGTITVTSWHEHTTASLQDKAATCTEAGYTGRTFCEVCNSVVDWGTDVEATGHTYAFADDKLACSDCGELFNGEFTDGKTYVDGVVIPDGWVGDSYYSNGSMLKGVKEVDGYYYDFGDDGICQGKIKFTGIFSDGEKSYFSKMGVLTSGWQSIADDNGNSYFYYFDESTYEMYTGVRDVNGLTYTFDESGKMVRGAFRTNENGTKYFVAGKSQYRRFIELEEGTYWLKEDGYVAYGNAHTVTTNVKDITWYHFDETTGLLTGICDGIIDYEGEKYYCENGKVLYGAVKVDDGIVFSTTLGKLVANAKCYIGSSTVQKGCNLETGSYWCDENGYILANGFAEIDGDTYYFDNYAHVKGFTKVGDDYYFFNAGNGKMYKNITLWVSGSNPYGIPSGYYDFESDGKMHIPDPNGVKEIVEENGKLYFTIDGVKQKNGLNELDGEYYYATSNGALVTGTVAWVSQKNDIITDSNGYYEFTQDGKMVKTGFVTAPDGSVYYYADAVRAKGFTKVGDDYYFLNAGSGKMYKDITLWVSGSNPYGIPSGYYDFGETGKMRVPDPNGVKEIVEENGKLYFTIDGVKQKNGLNELDGEYYYATSNGALVTGTVAWVSQKNDLITDSNGYYEFTQDGKMVKTGFVTAPDGSVYYYADAVRAKGFTKVGDDYYFFNAGSGKMYRDTTLWVSGSNAYGVASGYYYFNAEGIME